MNFNHVPVKYRSLALVLTLSMPTSLGFAQTVSNENSTPPAMMQEGNMPAPPDGQLPPGPRQMAKWGRSSRPRMPLNSQQPKSSMARRRISLTPFPH